MPLYNCGRCRKFSTLSPGVCVLCGGTLIVNHVPSSAASQMSRLLSEANSITTRIMDAMTRIRGFIPRVNGLSSSIAYQYTPSFIYQYVVGDPAAALRQGLAAVRQELVQIAASLMNLLQAVENTGAAGRVQTLATIDARRHALIVIAQIREMLGLVNVGIEGVDTLLARVR